MRRSIQNINFQVVSTKGIFHLIKDYIYKNKIVNLRREVNVTVTTKSVKQIQTFAPTYCSIFQHYALVEYRDLVSVKRLIANTQHFPNEKHIPVQSRFIFFRKNGGQNAALNDKLESRIIVDRPKELADSDLLNVQSVSKRLVKLDVPNLVNGFTSANIQWYLYL